MNDIGYDTSLKFKGSYAESNIKHLEYDALINRKRYTEMAVDYHVKENNPSQIEFFTEELNFINKRLKRIKELKRRYRL
jgi:hypothetical protein